MLPVSGLIGGGQFGGPGPALLLGPAPSTLGSGGSGGMVPGILAPNGFMDGGFGGGVGLVYSSGSPLFSGSISGTPIFGGNGALMSSSPFQGSTLSAGQLGSGVLLNSGGVSGSGYLTSGAIGGSGGGGGVIGGSGYLNSSVLSTPARGSFSGGAIAPSAPVPPASPPLPPLPRSPLPPAPSTPTGAGYSYADTSGESPYRGEGSTISISNTGWEKAVDEVKKELELLKVHGGMAALKDLLAHKQDELERTRQAEHVKEKELHRLQDMYAEEVRKHTEDLSKVRKAEADVALMRQAEAERLRFAQQEQERAAAEALARLETLKAEASAQKKKSKKKKAKKSAQKVNTKVTTRVTTRQLAPRVIR
jgi:hypothetical protein